MSTPWSAPDPRRPASTATSPAVDGPPAGVGRWDVRPGRSRPPLGPDLRAGALTALLTLLVGAPVGLLWSALAPRADVVVTAGRVDLVEPNPSAFIAAEGYFLAAVLLAGILGGVTAWALARPRGPGVVVGLVVGGLAAAYVAMVVGQQVGGDEVRAAVDAGGDAQAELRLRLQAREALLGWPIGALLGYVAAMLQAGPGEDEHEEPAATKQAPSEQAPAERAPSEQA